MTPYSHIVIEDKSQFECQQHQPKFWPQDLDKHVALTCNTFRVHFGFSAPQCNFLSNPLPHHICVASQNLKWKMYVTKGNHVRVYGIIEGSLEVSLPTICRVEKQSRGVRSAELKSRVKKSGQQKEDQHPCRVTRKKLHVREKLATPRIAVFFQWFVVADVRKVASLKRRVQRYLFSRQVKNGTPLWREAHFQVKMHKTPQSRTHFGSSDVQTWHAAVARSTFASKNAQNTTCSDHFWRSDVQKSHAAVARSTFASQNVQNTCFLQHFERFLTDSLTN